MIPCILQYKTTLRQCAIYTKHPRNRGCFVQNLVFLAEWPEGRNRSASLSRSRRQREPGGLPQSAPRGGSAQPAPSEREPRGEGKTSGAGLTKALPCPIITVKSEPRTRLAPQRLAFISWRSHKNLLSLMRSGGRFFIVLCLRLLGSFPDDDRHGVLSYVEGQTHTHHLLLEGWNQPPACECSLFTVPFRGLLFYLFVRYSSRFS